MGWEGEEEKGGEERESEEAGWDGSLARFALVLQAAVGKGSWVLPSFVEGDGEKGEEGEKRES